MSKLIKIIVEVKVDGVDIMKVPYDVRETANLLIATRKSEHEELQTRRLPKDIIDQINHTDESAVCWSREKDVEKNILKMKDKIKTRIKWVIDYKKSLLDTIINNHHLKQKNNG